MWTAAIIEVEVTADRVPRLANAFVGPQIYLLVFDAAPQPLDEHVVPPCSFAIHADCDAVAGERAGEGRGQPLRSLFIVWISIWVLLEWSAPFVFSPNGRRSP